jgi:hypothetical protein
LAPEYIVDEYLKMGTFPKRSEDHKLTLRKRSGEGGGNNDLSWFAAAVDLLDQLRGRLSPGFGVAGIDGDDFRVEEFHQRRAADARHLQVLDSLLLQIFADAKGEGVRRATSAVVSGVMTLAACS